MRTPIIPLTLAYIAGLLLGHGFLYFPYTVGIIVPLCILTAGLFTWFDIGTIRRIAPTRYFLIVSSCLIGMAAYLSSAAWSPADHYTRHFRPDKTVRELVGRIASPLDRDPGRTGFVLELSKIDNTPVTGKIRVSAREELHSVGYGDTVRVTGKLLEPRGYNNPGGFDYAAYLARSGVFYTVSVKNADKIELLSRGTGIFRKIQDWRERIRQAFLASTKGPGSAIQQAMVLGEEGLLTDELRDRFMAAGVTHIISISGSHLGMVAVLCFGLIRGLLFMMPERFYHSLTLRTDPKNIAAWLTLPLVIFYTLLAGGQVATVRSLVMITAGLAAIILDRENALMRSLALAALLILIASPQAIFDISFQLSYLSVFVIGLVVTLWNDLPFFAKTRFRKIRNGAILLVVISLSATLATGPLVAHYFNQLSLAGIFSNLIVVPFAGMVVVPLGLFSGIVSLFTHHLPLAGLNQIVSDMFISVVFFFSRLPFAEFHPPAPSRMWLILYAVFFISLFMHTRARLLSRFKPFESSLRVSKRAIIGMALAGVFLMLPLAGAFIPKQRTMVSFPDIGQGDCALIELPGGKTILIDGGGTRDNRFDIGRRVLAPWLWNKGIRKLDLVILSHPHPDHINGLIAILKKFEVAAVWESGLDTDLPGYAEFRRVATEKNIMRRTVSADDPPMMVGEAELRILHPSREFYAHDRKPYMAENNRSLVVQLGLNGKTFLFTGDIGRTAEQWIIETVRDLKCYLMKVPHHGSKSSSSDAFVNATRPEVAVVTVGRGNQYRHPSEEVIERYLAIGSTVYRTDTGGAITLKMSKDHMEVATWKEFIFSRITLAAPGEWAGVERQNRQRLWKRMML